jgi:diphosphomevalonate decarboxylase
MTTGTGLARARANIALAKYWGKADLALNLPAVPSVSVTLEPMITETRVTLDARAAHDSLTLGGVLASAKEQARAVRVLDRIRAEVGAKDKARVESANQFPTASGLASSASGFAALVSAARRAYGLPRDPKKESALARWASASAGRSIYGGFVLLPAGTPGDDSNTAVQLHPASHWDLRLTVAVITEARKDVGSTDGMGLSKETSPYYAAWVAAAPAMAKAIEEAIAKKDLAALGPLAEHSFASMHALALSTSPPTLYFQPASLAALATVRKLRESGMHVYATMDAGPHVKAISSAEDAPRVKKALLETPGVLRVLEARPGPDIEVE